MGWVYGLGGWVGGWVCFYVTLILPKVSSGVVVSKRMDSTMLSGLSLAMATCMGWGGWVG